MSRYVCRERLVYIGYPHRGYCATHAFFNALENHWQEVAGKSQRAGSMFSMKLLSMSVYERNPILNLHTYQQILSTDPRFGVSIQPPVDLLEYAVELQFRISCVISRQLAFVEKNYAMYSSEEYKQDKQIHLSYLMNVCQALARFCSAANIPLQECETYRCTTFGQRQYTRKPDDRNIWQKIPSFSAEQSIWYPGIRELLLHSTFITHACLWRVRHPQESTTTFQEDLALLWTCLYELINVFGFQVAHCLEQSQKGEFIEKTGHSQS